MELLRWYSRCNEHDDEEATSDEVEDVEDSALPSLVPALYCDRQPSGCSFTISVSSLGWNPDAGTSLDECDGSCMMVDMLMLIAHGLSDERQPDGLSVS